MLSPKTSAKKLNQIKRKPSSKYLQNRHNKSFIKVHPAKKMSLEDFYAENDTVRIVYSRFWIIDQRNCSKLYTGTLLMEGECLHEVRNQI